MAKSENTKKSQPPESRFLVVGVVASAGGLEAFKQLLSAVPEDCGMAFVLVPHLDPNYESQMVSLLAKICVLPVVEASQGMAVEPNHVYVIPSSFFLTIAEGVLQLSEPTIPQTRETAIDYFLRSLATDCGEYSVGIVLSGTGSHGTLGIRDIKLAGGLAIAQLPTTAEFDTMPTSIIREGLADYVLPPAEMSSAIIKYAQQPYLNQAQRVDTEQSDENEQLAAILAQLRKHKQYDFSSYRKNMMLRRVQRRMGLLHLERMQEYVERINEDPKEADSLYRDMLISVTSFFRDPNAFSTLREKIAPEVKTRDVNQFPFRVWVAGCATGEEAYSLALILIECFEERSPNAPQLPTSQRLLQVFASDVDEAAITIARAGVYPASIANDISQARLSRFFTKNAEGNYQIDKQLREAIAFSKQNLISDAPFSKLDFISCRNLLIYLKPEMQRKVISLFHFALADNGILLLGPSESISQSEQLFEPISKKWRIFRRLNLSRRSRVPLPLIGTSGLHRHRELQTASVVPRQSHKELVEEALINFYAPATVLINRRYEVLYVTGPLVDYLEFPMGQPSHNLLSMCRPGLRTKLRFACQESIVGDIDTKVETHMKRGNATVTCSIHVRNLKTQLEVDPLQLISFSDIHHSDASLAVWLERQNEKTSPYSDQLERELRLNTEELGTVIDELEGANEDLKSSNEEIMSMNEELQSANEELETSKEELQSLNEELSTVNLELLEKVTDLDTANNDILNLLASTEIATLFLDEKLLIQRFTPPTTELLNLRSTDVGRPLSDITTRFIDDSFLKDCERVIQESTPIQNTIEGGNSRMYLRRILPYRSSGDHVLGVVITFVDLTERLSLEKSLKQSKDHLEAILDSAVDAILTVNEQGVIARINPATERLFGYSRDKILGRSVIGLLTSTEGSPSKQAQTMQMLPMPDFGTGNYLELKAKRKGGPDFDAELTVSRIDHLQLFIVVIRDVTERKELEKKILEIASDEQRRIGQELHDGTQQELTGLSLIAGTLEEFISQRITLISKDQHRLTLENDELTRLMNTATKLVRGLSDANRHVQSLSRGIMPVQIDVKGLNSALSELANETTVKDKIVCKFIHSGSPSIDSNAMATHLYRIAQEAINNAQRHGEARNICIKLDADTKHITLEVTDDGLGMDDSLMKASGKLKRGAGLQIMAYRASVIGGKLSVMAGKVNGTTVRCTIPK